MIGAALILVFLALLFFGVPIVAGIAIVSLAGILLLGDVPLVVIAQTIAGRTSSLALLAIPLFLLMGGLMNAGGISRRFFDLASALVGHLRGGLAQVDVLTSALMGGLSGSSAADASLTSKVLVPAMVRHGYDPHFAASVTASTAIVAPLIPPSIGMIIYASLANVSVGALFVAGILPGLALTLLFGLTVGYISRRRNYRSAHARAPFREVVRTALDALWALVLPFVVVAGIRFGIFTATEAAAVGALYTLVIGLFVYRELSLSQLPGIIRQTAVETGVVMLIIGVSAPLAWYLTVAQIPQAILGQVNLLQNPLLFLVAVNALLLLFGMVLEATSLLILAAPILAPVAAALGIDPVHFGLIVVLNVQIGTITPPVGQLVYIVSAVTKIDAEGIFVAGLRLLPSALAILIVITYFPGSFMWLVELLRP